MATSTIKQVTNNSGANYCKMPDGTLIQWGTFSSALDIAANTTGEDTITFPTSFASFDFVPIFSVQSGAPAARQVGVKSRTSASVSVFIQNIFTGTWSHPTIYWIAIGRWK